MESMQQVTVGGIRIDAVTEADVLARVRRGWASGVGGVIVTVNVDILRSVTRSPLLAPLVAAGSVVVADGMPLVWASRLARSPLPERVTGASLVGSLCRIAAADGRSVYLLGGEPGVPERAATNLAERLPALRVVGTQSPARGFELDESAMSSVVERVRACEPDLVLVALGFPKQEQTIARLREVIPTAWYLGCGAGIPMAAGQFSRAPTLLQRAGLEWIHRLALEPRRLAGRYLRDDLPFAVGLLGRALTDRFRPPA